MDHDPRAFSRSFSRRTALASLAGAALAGTAALPAAAAGRHGRTVRFATFNASLNRGTQGALVTDLSTPDNAQARNVAETIQRVNPDVLLINEFDYDEHGTAVRLFLRNYLAVGHNGSRPIHFPYHFTGPVNTGVASGVDLDGKNGAVTTPGSDAYGQDAFGYGFFPGQYGMVVLSKYPIDTRAVRSFQHFLWKDMPGHVMPPGYYSDEARAIFRLSSRATGTCPSASAAPRRTRCTSWCRTRRRPPSTAPRTATADATTTRSGSGPTTSAGATAAPICTTTRGCAADCGPGRGS